MRILLNPTTVNACEAATWNVIIGASRNAEPASGSKVPIAAGEGKWKRTFARNAEVGEAAIRYALAILSS